jgi:hypothetical protein
MSEEQVQESPPVEQSTILSPEEVTATVTGGDAPKEDVVLPSEEPDEVLYAGKYKSIEDMEKAYKELESKLGQPKTAEETQEAPQPTEEVQQEKDPEYEAYLQEKAMNKLLEPYGGMEKYTQASEWANSNFSEQEIAQFNTAIDEAAGNEAVIGTLIGSFMKMAEMGMSKGEVKAEPIHSSETTKVERNKGYETKSDMMKDINDPRYHKDPSFRDKVASKVALTNVAAWYANLPKY